MQISLAVLLSASAAISEDSQAKMILGAGEDGSDPIEVTANTASFSSKNNVTMFSGGVSVVQGTIELFADQVIVQGTSEDALEMVRVDFLNNVRLQTGIGFATADSGSYEFSEDLIKLTGNVVLGAHDEDATATGEVLLYNFESGTVSLD